MRCAKRGAARLAQRARAALAPPPQQQRRLCMHGLCAPGCAQRSLHYHCAVCSRSDNAHPLSPPQRLDRCVTAVCVAAAAALTKQGLTEREEQLEKKKLLLEKKINDEVREECVCGGGGEQSARTAGVCAAVEAHRDAPQRRRFCQPPTARSRAWLPALPPPLLTPTPPLLQHHPLHTLHTHYTRQLEKAREFTRQKKKSQALMCLKKKKMYEAVSSRPPRPSSLAGWSRIRLAPA